MMARWTVVLALLASASAAHAQPTLEAPPVPPETESAVRGRAAPAAESGKASAPGVAPRGPAAASGRPAGVEVETSTNAAVDPAAASGTGAARFGADPAAASGGAARARVDPAAASGTGAARFGSDPAAARTNGAVVAPTPPPGGAVAASTDAAADPLRVFPPAPPPAEPGPPEQPTTALTSFAPAPEPPPGGAAKTSASTDASGSTATVAPPSAASEPAAISGSEEAAPHASSGALWSAEALVGVGVTFDNTVAGVNPLGFGFGVRGDYRVAPNWSLGARMLYFVGGSVELPTSDVAMQTWLVAAEAAYVIDLDQILIQPGLALGLHVRETDYRGFGGLTGSPELLLPPGTVRFGLYVAPGVNLAVPLALVTPSLEPLIVGADVRLDMAFGKGVTSNVQLLVLAGFQF